MLRWWCGIVSAAQEVEQAVVSSFGGRLVLDGYKLVLLSYTNQISNAIAASNAMTASYQTSRLEWPTKQSTACQILQCFP
eukprot:scaffold7172_cov119-Alexandrium_tamarense.AAC.4